MKLSPLTVLPISMPLAFLTGMCVIGPMLHGRRPCWPWNPRRSSVSSPPAWPLLTQANGAKAPSLTPSVISAPLGFSHATPKVAIKFPYDGESTKVWNDAQKMISYPGEQDRRTIELLYNAIPEKFKKFATALIDATPNLPSAWHRMSPGYPEHGARCGMVMYYNDQSNATTVRKWFQDALELTL